MVPGLMSHGWCEGPANNDLSTLFKEPMESSDLQNYVRMKMSRKKQQSYIIQEHIHIHNISYYTKNVSVHSNYDTGLFTPNYL